MPEAALFALFAKFNLGKHLASKLHFVRLER
jgi:hypothetical protein